MLMVLCLVIIFMINVPYLTVFDPERQAPNANLLLAAARAMYRGPRREGSNGRSCDRRAGQCAPAHTGTNACATHLPAARRALVTILEDPQSRTRPKVRRWWSHLQPAQ